MRANANAAVSDHAYMAGKAVSYAYEFRYCPILRNLFLKRFKWEYSFLNSVRDIEFGDEVISWNSRAAGVTLANITSKLVVDQFLDEHDLNCFCIERYGLMASSVIDLFEQIVVSNEKIDVEGIVVNLLACDFMSPE